MPKSVLFDREEVLQKVTTLFWRKGYNATSMQDLVDATGLNRSSIYNSFGDKFQLYEESLKRYQQLQQKKLETYFSGVLSPKQAITSLFEGIRDEIIGESKSKGCFLSNCTTELGHTEPKIHDFLVKNKNTITQGFTGLIQKAQETGEIDHSKNAGHLALYLFSSLQGLRVTSMLGNKNDDIQGITQQILSVL